MSKRQDKKASKKKNERQERARRRREAARKAREAEERFTERIAKSAKLAREQGKDGEDEYPPEDAKPEGDAEDIFDVAVTPEYVPKDYKHLAAPPRPGQHVITMGKRSYTPPVWQDSPGGGGPTDYFLFPGVMGYAVLKNDGTVWVCTPEPEEENHRTDWSVVEAFLNALHERCRVVNCVWGQLQEMLPKLGWVNRPEKVVAVEGAEAREIDVWYPPPEGSERQGYVEGGIGEIT